MAAGWALGWATVIPKHDVATVSDSAPPVSLGRAALLNSHLPLHFWLPSQTVCHTHVLSQMRADLTEKLFRAYDADTNGYLDLDEFIMLVQVPPPQTPTLLDRPDKPHTKQLPDGMSLTCRFPGGRNTTLQWILRESRRALRWLAAQEATLTPICLHITSISPPFTSIYASVDLFLSPFASRQAQVSTLQRVGGDALRRHH